MIGKQYEYEAMARCEKELWWYKSLHELTLSKIKAYSSSKELNILDAGCGTGGFLAKLENEGYTNVQGFDLSEDAVKYASSNTQFKINIVNILEADKAYNQEPI